MFCHKACLFDGFEEFYAFQFVYFFFVRRFSFKMLEFNILSWSERESIKDRLCINEREKKRKKKSSLNSKHKRNTQD